jgi:hypothetical protein
MENIKAYLLTFDKDDLRDYNKIHKDLTSLKEIINWSHYIKSSYVLITTIDNAAILNKKILKVLSNKRYLLIEVNLSNRNGRLPFQAWEWFKRHADGTDKL